MRLNPQRITDSSLRNRDERLHVKQLDASGLKHRSPVNWAVIGDENKRLQRRRFTGVARTPKLRGFLFLFRAVNFSAFDAFAQLLLERTQNLIAPSCILPVLLIAVQPKGSVDADEHKEQFGCPAPNT
jgi:hypothetical protein